MKYVDLRPFHAVDDSELGALGCKTIFGLNEKLTRLYELLPVTRLPVSTSRRDGKPRRGRVRHLDSDLPRQLAPPPHLAPFPQPNPATSKGARFKSQVSKD